MIITADLADQALPWSRQARARTRSDPLERARGVSSCYRWLVMGELGGSCRRRKFPARFSQAKQLSACCRVAFSGYYRPATCRAAVFPPRSVSPCRNRGREERYAAPRPPARCCGSECNTGPRGERRALTLARCAPSAFCSASWLATSSALLRSPMLQWEHRAGSGGFEARVQR